MNKIVLFLLTFMSSYVGANSIDLTIVKIKSYPCLHRSHTKYGSGIAFTYKNNNYVLTSDHVLFGDLQTKEFCHLVKTADGNNLKAEVAAFHLGRGVALLILKESSSDKFMLANQLFASASMEVGTFVTLAGYPVSSQNLSVDNNAQLINAKSERAFLPLIKYSYEVKGFSEYGMSGGALFDKQNHVRGMISHQYLQIPESGKPMIENSYVSQNLNQQEVIAQIIPLSEIKEWLSQALERTAPSSVLDLEQLSMGKEVLSFSGLKLTWKPCQNSENNAGNIGGGGIGIGGDGIGVGGGDDEGRIKKPAVTCDGSFVIAAETNLQNTNELINADYKFLRAEWFKQLKQRLYFGRSAQVNLFLSSEGNLLGARTFLRALILLERGWVPLIKFQDNIAVRSNFGGEQAIKLSNKIQTLASALKSAFSDNDSILRMLIEIETYMKYVQNQQMEVLTKQVMATWLASSLWNRIFYDISIEKYSMATDLKSNLLRLEEILNREVL